MKRMLFVFIFVVVMSAPVFAADFTGDWQLVTQTGYHFILKLTQTGSTVTGTMEHYNPGQSTPSEVNTLTNGAVIGGMITFTRSPYVQNFVGLLTKNKVITGLFSSHNPDYSYAWDAVKLP